MEYSIFPYSWSVDPCTPDEYPTSSIDHTNTSPALCRSSHKVNPINSFKTYLKTYLLFSQLNTLPFWGCDFVPSNREPSNREIAKNSRLTVQGIPVGDFVPQTGQPSNSLVHLFVLIYFLRMKRAWLDKDRKPAVFNSVIYTRDIRFMLKRA